MIFLGYIYIYASLMGCHANDPNSINEGSLPGPRIPRTVHLPTICEGVPSLLDLNGE